MTIYSFPGLSEVKLLTFPARSIFLEILPRIDQFLIAIQKHFLTPELAFFLGNGLKKARRLHLNTALGQRIRTAGYHRRLSD